MCASALLCQEPPVLQFSPSERLISLVYRKLVVVEVPLPNGFATVGASPGTAGGAGAVAVAAGAGTVAAAAAIAIAR